MKHLLRANSSQQVTGPRLLLARFLFTLSSRIAALLARYEAAFVTLVAVLCTHPWTAGRRLWYDELGTFYVARQPDLATLFRALPPDCNPPLYYLLARISMGVLGPTEFAVRLPSIVAFAGAALAAYWFVRRRRGPALGLFAMLALACCNNASYATEARPYALMLGFTGLTLVSWQAAAASEGKRLLPLLGVSVGIAGAVASHHYGVIHVGLLLLFGESVRLWKRRRLDIPMYGACAAGLSMLAVTLPFAAASQHVMLNYVKDSISFWAKPGIGRIQSYGHMFCLWLPGAFLVLLALTSGEMPDGDPSLPDRPDRELPLHEVAAATGLTLLVPAMIGVTWLATGYYQGRYAIGSAMGIAILAGVAAPLAWKDRSRATAAAILCIPLLGAQLVFSLAHAGAHYYVTERASPAIASPILAGAPGREPIVVASALTYLPEWWYAPPELRARLHYLADLPVAVRQPDFLPELELVKNQRYLPSKVDDYGQFVSTHNRFLLYCVGSPNLEWTAGRLRREGWSLKVLRTDGKATLYLTEAPRA